MYEVFEHTADLGLRVRAATLDRLFADAARGLFAILVADLDAVRGDQTREYEIDGGERDLLLLDWLSELLFAFDTQRLVMAEFDVRLGSQGLQAVCRGEPLDESRHGVGHEVKAVTYHGLKVEQTGDDWLAEVILDL